MSNSLKVRDDHTPIHFEATGEGGKFKLCEGAEASWLTQSQTFGIKELRSRVEPWLTALFQSEHLSLLAGSGLIHAVHRLATGKPAAGMSEAAAAEVVIIAKKMGTVEQYVRNTSGIVDEVSKSATGVSSIAEELRKLIDRFKV